MLPMSVSDVITDAENDIFVSIASYWEASIKASLGKLPLTGSTAAFQARTESMNIVTLPISAQALDIVRILPFHHKDPFDRIIIATALAEGLTLISVDAAFAPYPVPQWWGN
jgi:PIN domain nuclease of toxin-antitoxin system